MKSIQQSERQAKVFELIRKGLSPAQIARELAIPRGIVYYLLRRCPCGFVAQSRKGLKFHLRIHPDGKEILQVIERAESRIKKRRKDAKNAEH